jgi:UDP-N-acetylglucosamine 1-carboxyvinyltransferase
MARFIIRGGAKLGGVFRPLGNKNAALPMLAASLLTDEPVVLHNVPRILDVEVMGELLASLGVSVRFEGNTVELCARGLRSRKLDPDRCRRVRSSILLAGPLTARHGRAELPPPGGDVIGRRRLDTHFAGLAALGIRIQLGPTFRFRRGTLRGADLLLDEASVTATENLLMAASLAEGRTTVFNAACEPHVQELGRLLNAMGARIEGLGTNRIVIDGVERLHGAEAAIEPDYIEAASFLAAAAATRGALRIEGAPDASVHRVIARAFRILGIEWAVPAPGVWELPAAQSRRIVADAGGAMAKIEDGPWPACPSDLMSVAIVLATQMRGSVLFFEKMFESRMYFVDRLLEMGARVIQCDPHRVVVHGPARLHAHPLSSPDLRAGMSLLIAACCARGVSVIDNAQVIDRGYERIDERLRALGARIEREE